MADFLRFAATMAEHMKGDLSRTDVLRSLIWPIAALLSSITICACFKVPYLIIILLSVLLVLFVLLYLYAYIYFMLNDPSALRSEKYSLEKLAIEHGVYGDSQTGLLTSEGNAKTQPIGDGTIPPTQKKEGQ